MGYFSKRVVKDSVFEQLKNDKNLMVTVTIPEGLGEKVCCSLKRKDLNTNKYYSVSIDNQVDTVLEIPFLDLYNYNKSILQMGSVIMLEDSTGEDLAVNWLIDNLNLNSLYEIISAIFGSIEEGYSVESIQNVVNNLVENKISLNQQQLFVVRQMVNFNIIQNASADIVQELIPILDNVFSSNTSWSSRSVRKLFI